MLVQNLVSKLLYIVKSSRKILSFVVFLFTASSLLAPFNRENKVKKITTTRSVTAARMSGTRNSRENVTEPTVLYSFVTPEGKIDVVRLPNGAIRQFGPHPID